MNNVHYHILYLSIIINSLAFAGSIFAAGIWEGILAVTAIAVLFIYLMTRIKE